MKKEDLDEIRKRIEGLSEIPMGFCFDQQGVWEKIRDRLREKAMKKDRFYVGLATISLIVFIVGLELAAVFLLPVNSDEMLNQGKVVNCGRLFPLRYVSFIASKKAPRNHEIMRQKKIIKVDSVERLVTFADVIPPKDVDSIVIMEFNIPRQSTIIQKRKFPVVHVNTLPEEPQPYDLPEQGKTKTAFFFKKKIPVIVFENAEVDEETKFKKKRHGEIFKSKNLIQ